MLHLNIYYSLPRAAHPVGSSVMILGGFGFLSRLYGLSIDALVEVEVVLADGSILIVNAKEHPGVSINCDVNICSIKPLV